MTGLIGDLLDVGRIETGTLSVSPEPSEVDALVDQAEHVSCWRRHERRTHRPCAGPAARDGRPGASLEAPCVNVDDDGDRLYSVARRDQGTIGAAGGGGGRWELHGGTGKYAAVTGRCTYQTQYLDDGWLVATGTCEWSRDAST